MSTDKPDDSGSVQPPRAADWTHPAQPAYSETGWAGALSTPAGAPAPAPPPPSGAPPSGSGASATSAAGPLRDDLGRPELDGPSDTIGGGPGRTAFPVMTAVLVAAVLIVAGFFGGVKIGENRNSGSSGAQNGNPANGNVNPGGVARRDGEGQFGRDGGRFGDAGALAGTVQSVSGNTVVVKASDGTVTKVTAGSGTTVTITRAGTLADLKPGSTVVVVGQAGSGGSIAATSIREGSAAGFGARGNPVTQPSAAPAS